MCLVLISVAGYRPALYGDIIGEKLKLSRSWVGVVMVASVTSLPELVTGVSSVTVAHAPDIAAGDVLGSCVFNLLLIVILDFLHRQQSVYTVANIGHAMSAGFGVILIGFVGNDDERYCHSRFVLSPAKALIQNRGLDQFIFARGLFH